MNFSKADLPRIKWSLLAFTLSLLLGGAAILLSAKYVDHARKERQEAQRELVAARVKMADAHSDLANMSIYAREYASLLDNKIIGTEQRLDWMEGLAKLQQHQLVVDFKYTIAPQQPYLPNPALDSGNFDLQLSGLTLQLDLLHEMQLLKILHALRSNIKGWFIIEHCTLERNTTTSTSLARLKAECAGGWITMKIKGTP
jgi:hypothetical protein